MIIAVRRVRVVQVAAHQIIHMVAVRHGGMAAGRAVRVADGVRGAGMAGRADGGVRGTDFECVFIRVAGVAVMQMTVVEIIRVALVEQGGVTARRAVRVSFGVT